MNTLKVGDTTFDLEKRTVVMGILNVTPDSFSDGGQFFQLEAAVEHALEMERQGADIIDIGGESTRPGAKTIDVDEELKRVSPVIEHLLGKIHVPLSIDTSKAEVASRAIDLGVSMVNDITALRVDDRLSRVVAEHEIPICLMHMKGNPKIMQNNPVYENIVEEIRAFLEQRARYALSCGISGENIIVDPGLGFGKRTGRDIEDNCVILHHLHKIKDLGFPLLIGPSRKTFIGNVCGKGVPLPPDERLEGSLAAACIAVANGADIVRVHDVGETRRCVDMIDCVLRS
jgi:dihydropteroate synthase